MGGDGVGGDGVGGDMALAVILLVPALATLRTAWEKLNLPVAPPWPRAITGALVVNVSCALILTRDRHESGSLTKAAFLSARNDALAHGAVISAGLVTAVAWRSGGPDLMVGLRPP